MASKLKSYSVSEKLEIVRKVRRDLGGNIANGARQFNVSRRSIREWMEKEQAYASMDFKKRRKRLVASRKPLAPTLEAALLEWFKTQRKNGLIVKYKTIREEAKRLKEVMGVTKNLTFTDSWVSRFCKRNKIRTR